MEFPKKWKMNDFWYKKNSKGPKISPFMLDKQGEKKFPTFAMWSFQGHPISI